MYLLEKQKAKKLVKAINNGNGVVKIHAGCGRHYLQGWINIDSSKKSKSDLCVDLAKGLPFPDNSADFIFNEHFIEHLSYEDGFAFFKESYRVLKPGGVLRTAFPDLDTLIDSYTRDTWRSMEWVKLIKADWYPSGCYMLNQCIRENGHHKYMYSVDDLKRRLCEAGFKTGSLDRRDVHDSIHDPLKGLEKRKDSSVVEAIK